MLDAKRHYRRVRRIEIRSCGDVDTSSIGRARTNLEHKLGRERVVVSDFIMPRPPEQLAVNWQQWREALLNKTCESSNRNWN